MLSGSFKQEEARGKIKTGGGVGRKGFSRV